MKRECVVVDILRVLYASIPIVFIPTVVVNNKHAYYIHLSTLNHIIVEVAQGASQSCGVGRTIKITQGIQ